MFRQSPEPPVTMASISVSAFATSGGAPVWHVSTTPPSEKDQEGFGGGLAADAGRIYAATGYGIVVALDARTGNKLWEKNVEAPVRTSPTARSFVESARSASA